MKKLPMRLCLATMKPFPKKELIRIVRTPEGEVVVDPSGKLNGRGAYISKSIEAVNIARDKKLIEKKLEVKVPEEVYDNLISIIGK